MKKFNFRIGDLEARSCNDHLSQNNKHTTLEINKWGNKDTCYTIAYWERGKEGFSLKFLGMAWFYSYISVIR